MFRAACQRIQSRSCRSFVRPCASTRLDASRNRLSVGSPRLGFRSARFSSSSPSSILSSRLSDLDSSFRVCASIRSSRVSTRCNRSERGGCRPAPAVSIRVEPQAFPARSQPPGASGSGLRERDSGYGGHSRSIAPATEATDRRPKVVYAPGVLRGSTARFGQQHVRDAAPRLPSGSRRRRSMPIRFPPRHRRPLPVGFLQASRFGDPRRAGLREPGKDEARPGHQGQRSVFSAAPRRRGRLGARPRRDLPRDGRADHRRRLRDGLLEKHEFLFGREIAEGAARRGPRRPTVASRAAVPATT